MKDGLDARQFNTGRPKTGRAKSAAQRQREVRERFARMVENLKLLNTAATLLHEEVSMLTMDGSQLGQMFQGADPADTVRSIALWFCDVRKARRDGQEIVMAEKDAPLRDGEK